MRLTKADKKEREEEKRLELESLQGQGSLGCLFGQAPKA